MLNAQQPLDSLNAGQLRALAADLIAQVAQREHAIAAKDGELRYRQAKIDQLTHEMAVLKRWRFGKSGEQLDPAQLSLLDETFDADLAAIEVELEQLAPTPRAVAEAGKPRRVALPPGLPRVDIAHEPESTVCTTPAAARGLSVSLKCLLIV